MSKPKAVQNNTPLANEQTLHTAKALIAAYKAAFGDEWAKVYAATVRISVSSYSDQR